MRYWLTIFLFLSGCAIAAGPKPDIIYSYHNDPPFYLPNQSTDLSRAFVGSLNTYLKANKINRQFSLQNIERPALNKIVASGQPYLILWANRLWFTRLDSEVKSSWSIFWDADIWVSSKESPFKYETPNDLLGKTIGVRKGFYYKGVTPLIRQAKVKAIEGKSYNDSLGRLERKEVDVFVMSRSSLMFWLANGFDVRSIFIAQSPHDTFTRNLLYSPHYHSFASTLEGFLSDLVKDELWQSRLRFWGVDRLTTPIELELEELIHYPIEKSP